MSMFLSTNPSTPIILPPRTSVSLSSNLLLLCPSVMCIDIPIVYPFEETGRREKKTQRADEPPLPKVLPQEAENAKTAKTENTLVRWASRAVGRVVGGIRKKSSSSGLCAHTLLSPIHVLVSLMFPCHAHTIVCLPSHLPNSTQPQKFLALSLSPHLPKEQRQKGKRLPLVLSLGI